MFAGGDLRIFPCGSSVTQRNRKLLIRRLVELDIGPVVGGGVSDPSGRWNEGVGSDRRRAVAWTPPKRRWQVYLKSRHQALHQGMLVEIGPRAIV